MEAVTWTEAALAGAGAAAGAKHPIVQWAATTRVRYGIPRGGGRWKLVPQDDAAALTAVRDALGMVYANKLAAAEQTLTAAERRWPALPGLLAVRCELERQRGAPEAARRLCSRAIANDGSSWAMYLLGILELRNVSPAATAAGIKRLREAIALDPDLAQAWRALGKALQRAKDTASFAQLDRDYQARFGSPLP
jgi:predicted Zn-dependent protease